MTSETKQDKPDGQSIVATETVTIYVCGDEAAVSAACRAYCNEVGLCVSLTPIKFIFTGGSEPGFSVGLINYARFPAQRGAVVAHGLELAKCILAAAHQRSCSVVTGDHTFYLTNPAISVPR